MGSRKEHCEDCLMKMGEAYDKVHRWIDGKAWVKGKLNINHRRYRHHDEGIEEVRKKWGDNSAEAARLHIMLDFGRVPTRKEVEDVFPDEPELMSFSDLNGD